jgi:hypothetical protein
MIKSNQPTPRFNTEVSNVNRNSLYYQLLINGNFDIWQEATTVAAASASDGVTYVSDQWYNVQSTTAKWNFALESTIVPIGSTYSLKCSASDVNIQVGVIQPIEFVNATKYRGKTASISFQAITTAGKTIDNLRCALVNWTGTADTLTRDIVGTWAGNGTNPTLIANTTILNTPVNLPLTTSWKTFKIENILIPLTVNNLLLFIWTDDTTITSGDEFYVTQVQVNKGTIALPFYPKDYNTELSNCQRYYEAGTATCAGGITGFGSNSYPNSVWFKVRKRIAIALKTNAYTKDVAGTGTLAAPKITSYKTATQYDNQTVLEGGSDTNQLTVYVNGSAITDAGMHKFYYYVDVRL